MYGQESAYILPNNQPNPIEFQQQLRQQQMQEQHYRDQMAMQQQHYQDGLLSDLAGRLDMKNFGTGTAYDDLIKHNLDTHLQQTAQDLKDGKPYGDVLMKVLQGTNDISDMSDRIKTIRAGVDAGAKEFQKDPSIDYQRLNKEAMTRALFKVGADGQLTLKDPTELDPNNNYIEDVLNKNPDKVVTGMGSLYDQIEKGKYLPYAAETTRGEGGIKRIQKYEGKYDPLYNELVDSKGNTVAPNSQDATGVRVTSKPVMIGNQSVPAVPDEVLDHFYQSRSIKASVQAQAKRLMTAMPQGTKQMDVEKMILHNELSHSANSYINKTKDTVDESQLQGEMARQQYGLAMAAIREQAKANTGKDPNASINDVYGRMYKTLSDQKSGVIPFQNLDLDGQAAISSVLKSTGNDKYKDEDGKVHEITPEDINIVKNGKGEMGVQLTKDAQDRMGRTNAYVGTLPYTINLKVPQTTTGKRTIIQRLTGKKSTELNSLRNKYNY